MTFHVVGIYFIHILFINARAFEPFVILPVWGKVQQAKWPEHPVLYDTANLAGELVRILQVRVHQPSVVVDRAKDVDQGRFQLRKSLGEAVVRNAPWCRSPRSSPECTAIAFLRHRPPLGTG